MKMELPDCPVETTLMVIGDKWKVLILRDLMSLHFFGTLGLPQDRVHTSLSK